MGGFTQDRSRNECICTNGTYYGEMIEPGRWVNWSLDVTSSSVRVVNGKWQFTCNISISSHYVTNILSVHTSGCPLSATARNLAEGSVTGAAIATDATLSPTQGSDHIGTVTLEGTGNATKIEVEFYLDLSSRPIDWISQKTDVIGIRAYGSFDVSDIPLKPTLKSSSWFHTFSAPYDQIAERGLTLKFTSDQEATGVACVITNLDNGKVSPIIDVTNNMWNTGLGKWDYAFNIEYLNWDEIRYAYRYSVKFGIKNKSGIWNTGGKSWDSNQTPSYSIVEAHTKNHLPIYVTTGHNNNNVVTGCTFRLEEVLFKAHTDIKVDILSHSCSAGRLIDINEEYGQDAAYWDEKGDGTDDEVTMILYGAIQPDTNITFSVTLAATRRLEPVSQYGQHTITYSSSGKTLRPAFISSMSDFFFYDPVKYTLFNESFFGCTVKFIVDLATDHLIWSDIHDRTVAYKKNQEITHNMTQTELDNTYLKWPKDVNEISIRMDVVTVGDYGTYTRSVAVKCKLNGNHLTGYIGVSDIPRRAKCWIGTNDGPRRCILWIGVDGKPRRCI